MLRSCRRPCYASSPRKGSEPRRRCRSRPEKEADLRPVSKVRQTALSNNPWPRGWLGCPLARNGQWGRRAGTGESPTLHAACPPHPHLVWSIRGDSRPKNCSGVQLPTGDVGYRCQGATGGFHLPKPGGSTKTWSPARSSKNSRIVPDVSVEIRIPCPETHRVLTGPPPRGGILGPEHRQVQSGDGVAFQTGESGHAVTATGARPSRTACGVRPSKNLIRRDRVRVLFAEIRCPRPVSPGRPS